MSNNGILLIIGIVLLSIILASIDTFIFEPRKLAGKSKHSLRELYDKYINI